MNSLMLPEIQRDELLERRSNTSGAMTLDLPHSPHDAELRISTDTSKLRSPRGGTSLHSPKAMSTLPIPRARPVDSSTVGFQENREEDIRQPLRSPTLMRAENTQPLAEDRPALARRSKSKISEGRRSKSPFNSDGLNMDAVPMEQEVVASAPRIRRSASTAAAAQEKGQSEWVILGRGKSPRRTKTAVGEVQDSAGGVPNERKSSRSVSTRRAKAEAQEVHDGDLGMGDANRVLRRGSVRTHTRQHKRKASDPITTTMPLPPSGPYLLERTYLEAPEFHHPYRTARSSATASQRRACREPLVPEGSDWMQFMVDIFMWRHIPRSSLLFGMGCFCILSTSVMQDMQYSAISVLSYIALFYLAATYIRRTFLHGANPHPSSSIDTVSEADALKLIRVLLPPINIILTRLAELFSGEPTMTLKVAAALWLLAQAGYMMKLWTLARLARNLLHCLWAAWDGCAHKKAILFAAFVLAWNFTSVSTRICWAFIFVVALRVYQHVLPGEQQNETTDIVESNRRFGMSSTPSYGLEPMTRL